ALGSLERRCRSSPGAVGGALGQGEGGLGAGRRAAAHRSGPRRDGADRGGSNAPLRRARSDPRPASRGPWAARGADGSRPAHRRARTSGRTDLGGHPMSTPSLADFADEARAFLAAHARPRASDGAVVWGEGPDRVTYFSNEPFEVEQANVQAARD